MLSIINLRPEPYKNAMGFHVCSISNCYLLHTYEWPPSLRVCENMLTLARKTVRFDISNASKLADLVRSSFSRVPYRHLNIHLEPIFQLHGCSKRHVFALVVEDTNFPCRRIILGPCADNNCTFLNEPTIGKMKDFNACLYSAGSQ